METRKEKSSINRHKTSAEILFQPITQTSKLYFIFVAFLSLLILLAALAYFWQLSQGLAVTGMRDRVSWSFYVTNFVFFIGISHAGTFISAVLRASDASWRHSVTRLAELMTAFGLLIGASMVLIDLGRIERAFNILPFVGMGRIQAPILWDFFAIAIYLTGSTMYLYLCLIPDFALLRDRLGDNSFFLKRWIWTILALGWEGSEEQEKWLRRGIGIMAWILIPVMISVHTVVSFAVGGVMLRPGWSSTVYGPYFVVGALYSGIAALVVIMAIFRKVYPEMEALITPRQFRNLGIILLVLVLGYGYFTFSEYMNIVYSSPKDEFELVEALFVGKFALLFWVGIIASIVIPGIIIAATRARSIRGLVIACLFISFGMWLKRFIIVVPSMSRPWIAGPFAAYNPTLIEWMIIIGSFAALALGFTLSVKFFPMAPLWEIIEEEEIMAKLREAGIVPPRSFVDYTFPMKKEDVQSEKSILT